MTDVTINPKHVRPLVGSTVVPKTCGVTATVGDIVYFYGDDEVRKTDADTAGTVTGRVGQIVAGGRHEPSGAIAVGERVTVLEFGRVSYGPDANLDLTKQYYVSNTAGKMGDVTGTITRRLGAPESSEVFFFNPDAVAATS
jgi:hypothetical protein